MKYKNSLIVLFLILGHFGFSHTKPEREHRIRKSQFPEITTPVIPKAAKRIRYYKEVDSLATIYTLKFRLEKINYHVEVDQEGDIQQLGFVLKEVDIPRDSYSRINNYLERTFKKIKVKRILQWYSAESTDAIRNTFQNLILPSNTYELLVRGKRDLQRGNRKDYKLLFNAEGTLLSIEKALPVNYDRVLY